eukprot:CAMPEP_0196767370 /NCGR_PEP_ID=MMETSP1095-20130614/39827_1 /TAXON_ID=96789 ORGANISM="Chromulina nebulosa, Strain UTEXLB2642" /NCGR_SAMPLE_ID=MMETSP1095 /ASSEMBLY_ACC=CAM_ASM_000446 /LENGTH=245 /DNA_ID=CAMNT_0042135089 /DNA_START=114 /DNA_END=851 /DNA_ORIENTATION=-
MPDSLPVHSFYNINEIVGSVNIVKKIFCIAIRKDIILESVRYHLEKTRQPYKTKRKSEIRGSNKKPHPQKGQGRAQAGHKRNAIWRGGHKAHGPVIRDFSIGMTRKQRAMAMMIAIAAKYLEGNLIIVDAMTVQSPKTREVAGALKSLGLETANTLLVDYEFTPDFLTASRNIKNIETMTQQACYVYEVVRKDKLVITVKGLEALQARLMAQYNHTGKRKSFISNLQSYRQIVSEGESIQEKLDR